MPLMAAVADAVAGLRQELLHDRGEEGRRLGEEAGDLHTCNAVDARAPTGAARATEAVCSAGLRDQTDSDFTMVAKSEGSKLGGRTVVLSSENMACRKNQVIPAIRICSGVCLAHVCKF